MSDKQNAVITLTFASQSCTAALASIGSVIHTDTSPPPLHAILAELDALLGLVYHLATKLALALSPASPAHSPSIPVLRDLAQHASALAHSTTLLHDHTHGATLAKDVRDRVKNIIAALRALVQTFLSSFAHTSPTVGSAASGEEYLIRTGVLHNLITTARGPSGIPKDNQIAVYRAWKSDRDSLEDALQEVSRMIEAAEDQHDSHDDFDDGWDEIGLGHATSMTKDELACTKNAHRVLRLTTLLHKRICLDILAHPSSAPPSAFDNLLAQSSLLLSVSDDLVAALYSPQDPDCLRNEIPKLADIATSLQTQLPTFLSTTDELTIQMHSLSVQDPSAPATSPPATKKRADAKWFDTCVHQILRLCANVSGSSSGQMGNPSSGI